MTKNIVISVRGIVQVLKKPSYIFLVIATTALIIVLSIWLSMNQFVLWVLSDSVFSLSVKLKLLFSTLGAFQTNFTFFSRITTTIVAVLSGVNIALLIFYFKKRIKLQAAAGTSTFGILAGLLGVGCSACGSVVLSSIFGLAATASVINILPFRGSEIGVVSVIILSFSIYTIAKRIDNPLFCKIKPTNKK